MKWNLSTAALIASILVSGCATQLTNNAQSVQLLAQGESRASCKSLGIIVTQVKLGPQKQLNAMNLALNEVAKRGGNRISVVSSSVDWAEGASVTAEALKCE